MTLERYGKDDDRKRKLDLLKQINHATGLGSLFSKKELRQMKRNGFILAGAEDSYDLFPDGSVQPNCNFLVIRIEDGVMLRLQDFGKVKALAYLTTPERKIGSPYKPKWKRKS